MRIMHIAPVSPYNVGWGYQENLLTKFQRKMGHEVCLVVSTFENTANGKVDVGETDFVLPDGIHVYRRRRFLGNGFVGKWISYTYVKDILDSFQPDLIMVHSLTTLSVFQAIQYQKKQNKSCVIIQDNHLDENIGWRRNKLFTDLYYGYWAVINRFASPYVARYYGVTPWRQEFLVKRFKIRQEKTDVLIMGADMDNIDFEKREQYRAEFDNAYGTAGKFLIATGGKIERNKKIAPLMEAVRGMENVKLIVFGAVSDDYIQEIQESDNDSVIMLGWQDNQQIYKLLLASDLAIFPGQHSVLWEQTCACKTPCLFAYWYGMDHLNNGGNSAFLTDVSVESLRNAIGEYCNTEKYQLMKQIARSAATDVFSYCEIAKKSVEMARKK